MNFELKIETPLTINQQIERFLRKLIQQSQGDENFRLPSTKELAKKWGVSCTAIDQAMAPLVAEGLLERRRKRGTFIKGNAGQSVIGIIFGSSISDEMAHFHRALRSQLAAEISGKADLNWTHRTYEGFYGLIDDPEFCKSPSCRNFLDDLSNYNFRGIVLISRKPELVNILKPDFSLPSVRLGPYVKEFPDVVMDVAAFGADSIKYLAAKGCRRIAYLRTFSLTTTFKADIDAVNAAAAACSLPTPEIQEISISASEARAMVEFEAFDLTCSLVKKWNSSVWPDAIIVSDDIAMRGAAMALIRNTSILPEKLQLMTLANEGLLQHYGLPVTRYEFSSNAVAKALVGLLADKIEGVQLPEELPVKISGRINIEAPAV